MESSNTFPDKLYRVSIDCNQLLDANFEEAIIGGIEQMAVAVVDCCRLHKLRLEAHELAHRVGDAEHRDQTLQGVVVGDDVFQIALAGLHRV